LRKYGIKAGIDISSHKLRNKLASRLLNQGTPIHLLRKLLGHQLLNPTHIYAQIYDQTLYRQFRETIARQERFADDAWSQTRTGPTVRAEMEVAEALGKQAFTKRPKIVLFRIWMMIPYEEFLVSNENSATVDSEISCLLPEQADISPRTDEYPESSTAYQPKIPDLPQNYQLNSCFPTQFILYADCHSG